MTATTNRGNEVTSTAIRKRGAELDRMYEEMFPDTDQVFKIADSEGYIISEQHQPQLFRHYTEIASLWTAQGYLPRCGPQTMPRLNALIQRDIPQLTRRNPTRGEVAFWSFCHRAPGYEIQVVDEESGQTPDYTVSIGNQKVIVEVKDIGRKHTGGTVGAIARRKIRDANKQLKTRTDERHPGLSVLHDPFTKWGFMSGPLAPDHIRAAMYGWLTLDVTVPSDPFEPSRVVREWAGKGRTTTRYMNTTTSAVCVLQTDSQLLVYHNCFAAIPIDSSVMEFEGVHQFRICDDMLKWLLIE